MARVQDPDGMIEFARFGSVSATIFARSLWALWTGVRAVLAVFFVSGFWILACRGTVAGGG